MARTEVAEAIFAADSWAAAELLHLAGRRALRFDRTTLAVLGIDDLLAGLGLDAAARLQWYREEVPSRDAVSQEYRVRKTLLRSYLGNPNCLLAQIGGEALERILATRRAALAPAARRLEALVEGGQLGQKPAALYRSFVHLHVNRLVGRDRSVEQSALGLLLRTRQGLDKAPVVPRLMIE